MNPKKTGTGADSDNEASTSKTTGTKNFKVLMQEID